jgi:hypothetical protein
MVKTNVHESELDAFLSSTKSASGFFKFGEGKTGLFPVYEEGLAPVSAFAKTVQYYNGEPTDRWVVYCLLALAQDKEALPEGYENKLIPISVPKTIAHGMAKGLISDEFTDAAAFTVIDENGNLTYGDMFIVDRTTEGKRTNYDVSIATKRPDGLIANVPVPEQSIQEYATIDIERVGRRHKEYLEEQSQSLLSGTDNAPSNDLAGFQ